jgi:ATP-dependent RNA helicase DDX41
VCPSRELAKQILETVEHFADCLAQQGMPRIKSCLIIGGTPVNQSLEIINRFVVIYLSNSVSRNKLLSSLEGFTSL